MNVFRTDHLDATFERVRASGADVLLEPIDQPWGPRDCAFRDPSGNTVRISRRPKHSHREHSATARCRHQGRATRDQLRPPTREPLGRPQRRAPLVHSTSRMKNHESRALPTTLRKP
jgi:hypothetical protein